MRRSLPAIAALMIALALGGCGSGMSSTGATTSASDPRNPDHDAASPGAAKATRQAAKAKTARPPAKARQAPVKPPKGASPTLRAIYRSFPTPVAGPGEGKAAAAAIAAGERACAGKTPLEVKEEFYGEAKEYLEAEQTKMIARIGAYEAHAATDPSFVAGQLAADVYAATLPEATAQGGYRGCVHALARGLERRLAPAGK